MIHLKLKFSTFLLSSFVSVLTWVCRLGLTGPTIRQELNWYWISAPKLKDLLKFCTTHRRWDDVWTHNIVYWKLRRKNLILARHPRERERLCWWKEAILMLLSLYTLRSVSLVSFFFHELKCSTLWWCARSFIKMFLKISFNNIDDDDRSRNQHMNEMNTKLTNCMNEWTTTIWE